MNKKFVYQVGNNKKEKENVYNEHEGPLTVFVTVCYRPYPQPVFFFNIHFNNIFSSTPVSRKISQVFHLVFCTTHTISTTSPTDITIIHVITLIYVYMLEYQLWRFSLSEVLWFLLLSLFYIQISSSKTVLTLNLHFSFYGVQDKLSQPYTN
jgi:hypothetical protein